MGFRITRFEAWRSLTLRPAGSLSRLRDPSHRSASVHVVTSIDRSDCYRLERQLPGGIRIRSGHPLRDGAFRRTTVEGVVDTSLAERKRWKNEVPACNIFVMSWSQILMETARLAASVPEQTGFGFSEGEVS